jgi:hypothetical protein
MLVSDIHFPSPELGRRHLARLTRPMLSTVLAVTAA